MSSVALKDTEHTKTELDKKNARIIVSGKSEVRLLE